MSTDLRLIQSSSHSAAATLAASLSTEATVSLLRTASALGRTAVVHTAKVRLCSRWGDHLPMAESYHTTNLGGTACLTPSPEDGPRPYTEALAVLRAAEEFSLQSVAKRAVYELTCSQDFWTAIEADRASVDISDGVLYQVGFMRYKLRHRWEAVLSDAPRTTLWRVTWGRVTRVSERLAIRCSGVRWAGAVCGARAICAHGRGTR